MLITAYLISCKKNFQPIKIALKIILTSDNQRKAINLLLIGVLWYNFNKILSISIKKIMLKSDKKRKNRVVSKSPGTIPAFLLKTYEILEVLY